MGSGLRRVVTAITTVVGGAIRSSRARLRKAIAEDLAILKPIPAGPGTRPALEAAIRSQTAELAAITLHSMRAAYIVVGLAAFALFVGRSREMATARSHERSRIIAHDPGEPRANEVAGG